MRFETVETGFWSEPDFETWAPSTRLLYLWTMTNPLGHGVAGITKATPNQIRLQTGLSAQRQEAAFAEMGSRVKRYPGGWLWLCARFAYACVGPKHWQSAVKYLSNGKVPQQLAADFWQRYTRHPDPNFRKWAKQFPPIPFAYPTDTLSLLTCTKLTENTEGSQHPKADADEPPAAGQIVPYENFAGEWNLRTEATHARRIANLTVGRKRDLAARWKDSFWRESWLTALDRAAGSRFLRGEVPPRDGRPPFKLDADFFLRSGTVEAILEGKYDDKAEQGPQDDSAVNEELDRLLDHDAKRPDRLENPHAPI